MIQLSECYWDALRATAQCLQEANYPAERARIMAVKEILGGYATPAVVTALLKGAQWDL